jgi:HEAT repeat protein
MNSRAEYRTTLRTLDRSAWAAFLQRRSGLPGPRANLELAQAVADEGDATTFDTLLATDDEYLVVCGTIGLGRLLAERPNAELEHRLRRLAADPRWRVREGVAMALQRLGDADLTRLHALVDDWSDDPDPLVLRAVAAGICEPRLLTTPEDAARAVEVCARLTDTLAALPASARRGDARVLRKALGYCWSVAVAADPPAGLPRFRALQSSDDADVAWVVRQNLTKSRLKRVWR